MNRSYSKIRHIQEANSRLEKRLISEQVSSQQKPVPQEVTDLYNKLKSEIALYQEPNNLRIDGNRLYYIGNIGGTTVMDRQGKVDDKRSQIGKLVKATDPNARFFEWAGTGWKRGEQNKYYDQAPVDLATATSPNFASLSLPAQDQNQNSNLAKR
jgi:hypothetical protein